MGQNKARNGRDASAETAELKLAPRRKNGDVVLRAEGITKRYGGIVAVDGVDLELRQDEILGIIGPNGAGKTTFFDLLTGFSPLDGGRVDLAIPDHRTGERVLRDVTTWPANKRTRNGLGRSFQDARLWSSLTVSETIAVAFERTIGERSPVHAMFGLPGVADAERDVRRRVDELVDLLGLNAFADKFVSELSTGSRRIVEIACVLAHRPSVLLLDEPSSGIAQKETEALGPLLQRVREYMDGSLIVVEHNVPLINNIADRIVALDLGAVIANGTPKQVLNDRHVIEAYLGTAAYDEIVDKVNDDAPKRSKTNRKPVRKKRPAVRR